MNCDDVRNLLALSAAGMLEAPDEQLVREHTSSCAECGDELAVYAAITYQISGMPVPQPSPSLVESTQRMMAEETDRRQGSRLALAASVLALGMTLASWELGRIYPELWLWNVWCLAAGGASVVATAMMVRGRKERSLS